MSRRASVAEVERVERELGMSWRDRAILELRDAYAVDGMELEEFERRVDVVLRAPEHSLYPGVLDDLLPRRPDPALVSYEVG